MIEHKVYWTEDGVNNSQDFAKGELGAALKLCELLRKRRAEGFDISFITCADEISDCTSLSGVSAPAADYEWKKLRLNRNE